MQERMVSWVLSVVEKSESSFVGLRVRESGARVMRFGLERRARVQGMRRKGAVVSEGAILEVWMWFESEGSGLVIFLRGLRFREVVSIIY